MCFPHHTSFRNCGERLEFHPIPGSPPVLTYNEIGMTSPHPLTRLIPVIAHAVAVFGDEQKATHWLSTPLPLLGERAPAELLGTDDGIAIVERTLTRIEHNIPS